MAGAPVPPLSAFLERRGSLALSRLMSTGPDIGLPSDRRASSAVGLPSERRASSLEATPRGAAAASAAVGGAVGELSAAGDVLSARSRGPSAPGRKPSTALLSRAGPTAAAVGSVAATGVAAAAGTVAAMGSVAVAGGRERRSSNSALEGAQAVVASEALELMTCVLL